MKSVDECRALARKQIQRSDEISNPHFKQQHVILSGQWLAMSRLAALHAEIEQRLSA